jgi:hypothetical protein
MVESEWRKREVVVVVYISYSQSNLVASASAASQRAVLGVGD